MTLTWLLRPVSSLGCEQDCPIRFENSPQDASRRIDSHANGWGEVVQCRPEAGPSEYYIFSASPVSSMACTMEAAFSASFSPFTVMEILSIRWI